VTHQALAGSRIPTILIGLLLAGGLGATQPPTERETADVIVVGAGVAGLSAAYEAGHAGARVLVIDMWSVFGGHAVMSEGQVSMVDTPFGRARGVVDSADLAYRDFVDYGEDANEAWVRRYVESSRTELYDWLTSLGVVFDRLFHTHGNSVPRIHVPRSRGLGLVGPIYRACLKDPDIAFRWNTKVERLLVEEGRIRGVEGLDMRTGQRVRWRSGAVVLATGGFQSNLALVRKHWPSALPQPERLLAGSGVNAMGSGLGLAESVGGRVARLDHQWNYVTGLEDPRFPGQGRGLNVRTADAIWVNAEGRRFVNEYQGRAYATKFTFPAVARQPGATFWAVFDQDNRANFYVAGTDWADRAQVERWILDNRSVVKSATTIAQLATDVGLPAAALDETVRTYNRFVDGGEDADFHRFSRERPTSGRDAEFRPRRIERSPFYAMQLRPVTRKSMGGVVIDLDCRVVDQGQQPIRGLYAAGELTGLAGINGKAGLEGTFLGPSMLTGRVAGRTAVSDSRARAGASGPAAPATEDRPTFALTADQLSRGCLVCHDIAGLAATPRPGYLHFEQVHRQVLERRFDCAICHVKLTSAGPHRVDALAHSETCAMCHGSGAP
jgi:flavocytochrome c